MAAAGDGFDDPTVQDNADPHSDEGRDRDASPPSSPLPTDNSDEGGLDTVSDDAETGDEAASNSSTLRVEGRYLLDTCGNRLVIRGVEQIFGLGVDVNGSWATLVDEIAKSGANAIRILPNLAQLSVNDVDGILARIVSHDMVVFISPHDRTWFGRSDVQEMLQRYEPWLIIDAFQEPDYNDRTRWQTDTSSAIATIRGMGYTVPLTVLANLYGRDLPSLFTYGAGVVAGDPLNNTILGWQAYWGVSGYYQGVYGMSLTQALEKAAQQPFPIQIGIDGEADPGDRLDYASAMAAAQTHDISWLWWDWYNPFGRSNNLSTDGTAAHLTAFGQAVLADDASSLSRAKKACAVAL